MLYVLSREMANADLGSSSGAVHELLKTHLVFDHPYLLIFVISSFVILLRVKSV